MGDKYVVRTSDEERKIQYPRLPYWPVAAMRPELLVAPAAEAAGAQTGNRLLDQAAD